MKEDIVLIATFYVVVIGGQQMFKTFIPISETYQLLIALSLPIFVFVIMKIIDNKINK